MIQILPAIDLIDGRCVRLCRGDYSQKKVYDGSPLDMALAYRDCGVKRLHIVDLDGAKAGSPRNLKVLETIATRVGCEIEWGGGVSSRGSLDSVLSAGASHAIVGSVAALRPELFEQWLSECGAGHLILGADLRNGLVAVKGWLEETSLSIEQLLERFLPLGLQETVCTDILRDGMLQGPNKELYTRLQSAYPQVSVTVSGGISSMDDIFALDAAGLRKVIVGKAIYENRITLKQIEQWSQSE